MLWIKNVLTMIGLFFYVDYVERYPHMTQLWQDVPTILASTASCEKGLSTQKHIKPSLRHNLSLETSNASMGFAMAKIPTVSINFKEFCVKWCALKVVV